MDSRPMPLIIPDSDDDKNQGKFCESGNYCSKDLVEME
jgi:hypothetical protein